MLSDRDVSKDHGPKLTQYSCLVQRSVEGPFACVKTVVKPRMQKTLAEILEPNERAIYAWCDIVHVDDHSSCVSTEQRVSVGHYQQHHGCFQQGRFMQNRFIICKLVSIGSGISTKSSLGQICLGWQQLVRPCACCLVLFDEAGLAKGPEWDEG